MTKIQEQQVTQIREAVMDMIRNVKFDEKKHIYTTKEGTWLQGVSTVSSIVPKDWLAAWGSKEAVKFLGFSDYPDDIDHACGMWDKIKKCPTLADYLAILQEAKGAAFRKSKDALIDGTAGHDWLERYVKAKIRGEKLPEMPKGMLERPLKQFVEWETENVDYWILSEARVAYPDKGYAGTLDGLAMMKTGKLAIIDFKFASHISEDYYLQTAGYQATFEPYSIKIDERIIIRLPKTLEIDVWDKVTHSYSKQPNNIEVKTVKTPYEMDRDVFFSCLPLKQWINLVKKED